jgi:hypothetical protein
MDHPSSPDIGRFASVFDLQLGELPHEIWALSQHGFDFEGSLSAVSQLSFSDRFFFRTFAFCLRQSVLVCKMPSTRRTAMCTL